MKDFNLEDFMALTPEERSVHMRDTWKAEIERLGVTQAEVAEAAGVHYTSLSRWLSGHHRPTVDSQFKIIRGLRRVELAQEAQADREGDKYGE